MTKKAAASEGGVFFLSLIYTVTKLSTVILWLCTRKVHSLCYVYNFNRYLVLFFHFFFFFNTVHSWSAFGICKSWPCASCPREGAIGCCLIQHQPINAFSHHWDSMEAFISPWESFGPQSQAFQHDLGTGLKWMEGTCTKGWQKKQKQERWRRTVPYGSLMKGSWLRQMMSFVCATIPQRSNSSQVPCQTFL